MLEQQDIIAFAQDKINALYEHYKHAAPGEYDGHAMDGMLAITKHLLDTAVRIEALNQMRNLGIEDDDVIRDIYSKILGY